MFTTNVPVPILSPISRFYHMTRSSIQREEPPPIRLKLLGYPAVWYDGEQISGFISEKAMALLIFICVEQNKQSREYLTGLLWGDFDEAKAKASLRSALHNLGKLFPGLLDVNRKTVALAPAAQVETDVEQLLKAGNPAVYTGDFLDGLFIPQAPAFEMWQLTLREQLRQRAIDGWEQYAIEQEANHRPEAAMKGWQALISLEPWREEGHRRLMRLMGCHGQFDAARHQFNRCKTHLLTELDILPAPETVALAQSIQMARSFARHNLDPLHRFFGRQTHLATIADYFQHNRLVTLQGMGGIGKTRLAQAFGHRCVNQYLHGVAFVSLAEFAPTGDLSGSLATILKKRLTEGKLLPHSREAAEPFLLAQLAQREMLLILDNFEHLLDGADLLDRLLQQAPKLHILVTSRERLRLQQEQVVPLDGLALDAAERLFVAIAQRVSPNFASSEPVRQICQSVAGFPLAVELAAGALGRFSPQQLAEKLEETLAPLTSDLRNRLERHQSISFLFETILQQLDPVVAERLLRLCVFQGAFSAEAAQVVTGADHRTLSLLVNKGVLAAEAGRYRMHPLLKQFSHARLAEAISPLRADHLAYFADLLQSHLPELEGGNQIASLTRLGVWEADIVAAWRWGIQSEQWEMMKRLLVPVFLYFEMQTRTAEAIPLLEQYAMGIEQLDGEQFGAVLAYQAWCEPTLAKQSALIETALSYLGGADAQTKAQAYLMQASVLHDQLDFEGALAVAQVGLDWAQKGENGRLINRCLTLMGLGGIPERRNKPAQGIRWLEQAAQVAREINDMRGVSITLHNLGWFHFYLEDYAQAELILRDVGKLHKTLKQPMNELYSAMMLCRAIGMQGRFDEAEGVARVALERAVVLNGVEVMLQLLTVLATEVYGENRNGDQVRADKLFVFLKNYPDLSSHLALHLADFEPTSEESEANLWSLSEAISFVLEA